MEVQEHRFADEPSIRFHGGSGGNLAGSAVALRLERDGFTVSDLLLTIRLSFDQWKQVDRDAAFHLDPDHRQQWTVPSFDPELPVRITLRLADDYLGRVPLSPGEAAEWLLGDTGKAPPDELRRDDSWYALSVTQAPGGEEAGALAGGFRTDWAEARGGRQSGRPITRAFLDFVDDMDWPFEPADQPGLYQLRFEGRAGQWRCFAQIREREQQFLFYSALPWTIPSERRPAMMEFVTRANFGQPLVSFEFDLDDGEVRCRSGIDVEGAFISRPMIRQLVASNLLTMDRYMAGMRAVAEEGADPAAAVRRIESG